MRKNQVNILENILLGSKYASKVIRNLYGHNKYSSYNEEDDDMAMEAG